MMQIKYQEITAEEREEYMNVGARMVADVKELIWSGSSKIKTDFRHTVRLNLGGTECKPTRALELRLFFTITDLGGSVKEDIEKLIEERLRFLLAQKENLGYIASWAFEVSIQK